MSINKELIAKNIRERRRAKEVVTGISGGKVNLSAQHISQIETKKENGEPKNCWENCGGTGE